MRLAALEELTARHKAVLPLDPPAARQVTLGGLVAANQSGPGRLLYGTVRDWLLGLRVVLPDGERIHCGGRVIKNVSGYDMNKLFIKSLGTLGIITEVTFKLLPMPAQRTVAIGLFPDARRPGRWCSGPWPPSCSPRRWNSSTPRPWPCCSRNWACRPCPAPAPWPCPSPGAPRP